MDIDQILRTLPLDVTVDRELLRAFFEERPACESVIKHLGTSDAGRVRSAVLYLGLHGTPREAAVLTLCLRHHDEQTARLAEFCLWYLWMQAGSTQGNQTLAEAVQRIKLGDFGGAIDILRVLVDREPAFAEAHFQCGLALESTERHAEAAAAYRETLRLNPYHFGAATALGHTCVEQGNLNGALHYYRKALEIHPRLTDVPDAINAIEEIVGQRHGQSG